MPRSPPACKRKPRNLLSQSTQITNDRIGIGPDTDPVQIAVFIAQFEPVRLVEDAELFVIAQIGHPLGISWPASPMMLIVKKVTTPVPLSWDRVQMSRFSTD